MGLDKILSITGKPGLYELKAQTRSGFIAESMLDGKKISVNVRQNVSMLSEIAIYTYTEEVPLREVFQKIKDKENGEQAISHKESAVKLEAYFREILPEYDEDRVYISDIKKVIQWYNLLQKNGMTDFSETKNETETVASAEENVEKTSEKIEKTKPETEKKKKAVEKAPAKDKKASEAKKPVAKKPKKQDKDKE